MRKAGYGGMEASDMQRLQELGTDTIAFRSRLTDL